jgi:hemoglobin/transferrin/lactoferrin receptor protein
VKRQLLSILIFCFSLSSYSQILSIEDAETGNPIELVTLSSAYPYSSVITNSRGQANVSQFKGSEEIEIRIVGYKTQVVSFNQLEDWSFKIKLIPSKVNLDEVIVSANKWNQNTSEIPARINSIAPQAIKLNNPQTAADMLSVSGLVYIQKSQQGGGSPMIRGFATNRLLYTVDGIRMNTAIFRGGNIQNVISLDPFSIEHVEVLSGPGSIIYGSDAIGGVMSFNTITPQMTLTEKPLVSGKALIRLSSANNEKTGHFDVNIGWKKWSGVFSITSNDYDHLKMGSYGPDEYLRHFYVQRQDSLDVVVSNENPRLQAPSGYTQMNLMQKIRFRPNDNWDIQYGFHYSETSEYSRYDRHIRNKNGLPSYGEWYYGPQKWMMNNLSITNSANNLLFNQVSLRIGQQYFEESRISRKFNDSIRKRRIENVDAFSVNIDFVKEIGFKNKFFYGIEAVQNYVDSKGIDEDISLGISGQGASRYPQSLWQSYGIYISDQWNIFEQIVLHTGLRYNYYLIDAKFDTTFYPIAIHSANVNNGAVTGNIGFVYRPDRTLKIGLNASTAFRSPNVDDIGKVFDSEKESVVVPNPDLEAEYAHNIDLSLTKVYLDFVKLNVTGYFTLLNNAMVRRDYTMNGLDSMIYDGVMSKVQAIQNASSATVYGIQAGVEIELPLGFDISSDINYQKGEEELDNGSISPSRHAAPFFGNSKFSYESGDLKLQFNCIYNGKKTFEQMPEEEKGKSYMYATDKNGNPWSPGWYTINFKALYQLNEQITLSSGVENITDQRYRPYSSGIVAPGRNFIIGMQASF